MKSETLFRTIGQISDEMIMEANAEAMASKPVKPVLHRADIFKRRPARNAMLRWGSVAACLVVALAITIPMLQRGGEHPVVETPDIGILNVHEGAELYDNLNIYYVTRDGTIAYESVYTRYAPEDIFTKWAELNNVTGVSLVKCSLTSNGVETIHGDPSEPDTMVSYTGGDYFTIEITLSSGFASYAEGENGRFLLESLEKTFLEYNDSIDIAEFHLFID